METTQEIRVLVTTDTDLIEQIRKVIQEELSKSGHLTHPPSISDKTILTREETAELLQVSLMTLHNWNLKGILYSRRIGNQVRYFSQDVDSVLRQLSSEEF